METPFVFPTRDDAYGHLLFMNVFNFLKETAKNTPCKVPQIVEIFTHPLFQEPQQKTLLQIRIYNTLRTLEKNNIIEVETCQGEHNISYKLITFKNPV